MRRHTCSLDHFDVPTPAGDAKFSRSARIGSNAKLISDRRPVTTLARPRIPNNSGRASPLTMIVRSFASISARKTFGSPAVPALDDRPIVAGPTHRTVPNFTPKR
jgi:hypothetical protein